MIKIDLKEAKKHQKTLLKQFPIFRSSKKVPKKCGSALPFGSVEVSEAWKHGSGRRRSARVVVSRCLSVSDSSAESRKQNGTQIDVFYTR